MSATLLPDFSINLNQRRWSCVLDPNLALSDYGLLLVKQLGRFLELWIAREFWHLIDNSDVFDRWRPWLETSPEKGNCPSLLTPELSAQTRRTLREWERLRLETDLGNHHLFWIGDGLGESLLPKETDSSLVSRWEWLARSLDRQIHTDFLGYAFRDAIALSAALGSAFILTHRSPEDRARNLPPVICSTLESWGINCQEIDQQDAIAALEREQLRQLFIQSGVSKLLWMGFHPVVLHLVVPEAIRIAPPPSWCEDISASELELEDWSETRGEKFDFWQGARGFWYEI
ncbi:MAG: hypothetical protein GPI94_07595 [Microcystis aeruginosa LG13-03]|nr:hypothetical protein [Microcystis aeruginosa LG13-13]NCR03819.1 hypothetical protein [Microcystis aeruginosa LG13-03]NCR61973.1 hypothetical protein [Microcystis aeruginosa LG11-05]